MLDLDLDGPAWFLTGRTDYPTLFRALVDVLPSSSILYFEGGRPHGAMMSFLVANVAGAHGAITAATLWPKPSTYHVPATTTNLLALATLAESCAEPEVALHFHVYDRDRMLLQWFDAFHGPMMLAPEFPRSLVESLASTLAMSFAWRSGRRGAPDAP
jgi:hypothetical protein